MGSMHAPTELTSSFGHGANATPANARRAHDATMLDILGTGFELRFDQHECLGARLGKTGDGGEHLQQTYEGYVDGEHRDAPRQLRRQRFGAQVTRIGTFQDVDTLVLTELPCELTVSDIDRYYRLGSVL